MDIQVFPTNADLPDHLRWQIISIIRMEWYESAGDYTGPSALPNEWHPAHVVGTDGKAIVSYAGVVRRDIEHAGQIFRTYGLSSVFTFPHGAGAASGVGSSNARLRESASQATVTSPYCSQCPVSSRSTSAAGGRRCRRRSS